MEKLELRVDNLLGDLSTDSNYTAKVTGLQTSLKKINCLLLEVAEIRKEYDKMEDEEKVQIDLLQLYAINTLFYIHLLLNGVCTVNHPIKDELKRVQEAMKTNKLLKEKPKPRIDKKVAEMFVRSGLWDPNHAPQSTNKKKRFDEVDTVNYDRW